ncbi:hypothetical protein COLO4_36012 [Corchorus olitorius]|uniref:Uncharacterized protein n=1 Tax=Corchorus olitorius TaxID=93759 RepID=A0A1R3GBD0_9ROSI|nr:hypothetical protein COLO4_36012 [Corchorus olitorius]
MSEVSMGEEIVESSGVSSSVEEAESVCDEWEEKS